MEEKDHRFCTDIATRFKFKVEILIKFDNIAVVNPESLVLVC